MYNTADMSQKLEKLGNTIQSQMEEMLQQSKIVAFRSKRHVVTIGVGSRRYKVLQIIFWKDGSVFVNFPYFKHSEGVASLMTVPSNSKQTVSVNFETRGKVTSHLVKYAHHPNGIAHFSQDGRVVSDIRKSSVPLTKIEGHLFTVHLNGITDFEVADPYRDQNRYTSKRTVLNLDFGESDPGVIKIVGMWYSINWFIQNNPHILTLYPKFGPSGVFINQEGEECPGFLLAPPIGNPLQNHLLMLYFYKLPSLSKHKRPYITFIGGFGDHDIATDWSQETTFLFLSYPVSNYEELKQRLGSVDLIELRNTC